MCITLSVLNLQARHAAQVFREIHLRRCVTQIVAVDDAHGRGRIKLGDPAGRGGHDHGLFISGGGLRMREGDRQQKSEGRIDSAGDFHAVYKVPEVTKSIKSVR